MVVVLRLCQVGEAVEMTQKRDMSAMHYGLQQTLCEQKERVLSVSKRMKMMKKKMAREKMKRKKILEPGQDIQMYQNTDLTLVRELGRKAADYSDQNFMKGGPLSLMK